MGVDKMRHAFVILAHKDVSHLSRLIKRLSPHYDLYIHLDKKMDISDKEYICQFRSDNVFVFSWRHVRWGGIQIIKTELQLVGTALGNHRYDYIHLISGQDFPIKDISTINDWFHLNNGFQFMEYHPLPVDKWENGTFARFQYYRLLDWFDYPDKFGKKIVDFITEFQIKHGLRRRIPDQYPSLFGGSNWMSLTHDCWEYITRKDKRSKRFLNRLRFTFASDEVFFHTVVMNSPFRASVINNNLRLIKWRGGAVKVLNQADLWDVLTSKSLFARKFETSLSKSLIDFLTESEDMKKDICFNSGFASKILQLCKTLNISTVCDITPGIGLYVKFLQDAGTKAYGLDSDSSVVKPSRMLFGGRYNCQSVDFLSPVKLDCPVDMIIAHSIESKIGSPTSIWCENIARNTSRFLLLRLNPRDTEDSDNMNIPRMLIKSLTNIGFSYNETMSKTLAYDMDKEYKKLYFFEKQ